MHGRVVLTALLFGILSLAGCTAEGPIGPTDESAFEGFETEATDTTGVIRGVVLDASITPIEGVTVSIANTELSTTSNSAGAFVFGGLEAGTYFLKATKNGYGDVQQSAIVEAGVDKPPVVKMQMLADPSTAAYVVPMVYEGYLQCAEDLVLVGYNGPCDNDYIVEYGTDSLDRMPEWAQSEVLWESTQEFGSWLTAVYSTPRAGQTLLHNYAEAEGPNPLVIFANRTLAEENISMTSNARDPPSCDGTNICIRVFSSSYPGTDIGRDYGDPRDGDNCVERPQLGGCTRGVSVTLEQAYNVYTHAFFNWEPVADWTFYADGSPEPPQ